MDYSNEPSGVFLLIDNKSFYATVECSMRGLDPLTTPLVVMSEASNTGGDWCLRRLQWQRNYSTFLMLTVNVTYRMMSDLL